MINTLKDIVEVVLQSHKIGLHCHEIAKEIIEKRLHSETNVVKGISKNPVFRKE